jgi:fatty acid desaturase
MQSQVDSKAPSLEGWLSESELRAKIREELPAEVFRKKPMRALFVVLLVGIILAVSVALITIPFPWYVELPGSLFIGNLYVSLMFIGHEIGHGATVSSRIKQDICLYFACGIFCLSPRLWRIWHGQVHHPNANMEGRDPDSFGTLEEFYRRSSFYRLSVKFAPGSGHWLGLCYTFIFFTLQAQAVLWMQSRRIPGFEHFNRGRAILDSALMAAFWVVVCIVFGPRATFFVVIIPMLTANFGLMSYIITNHMLRPMTEVRDTLSTTISVNTLKIFDILHFNFSHHVEHHLFPNVPGSSYPAIRQCLRRLVGDRYMSPPHWWAFLVVYRTPRIYENAQTLIEPYSGRKVRIVDVETMLLEMVD